MDLAELQASLDHRDDPAKVSFTEIHAAKPRRGHDQVVCLISLLDDAHALLYGSHPLPERSHLSQA
jgi:hypothetical protein